MRSRSRACNADLARSRRYLRRTRSMSAERECFDLASRSMLSKTSSESVIEVLTFILTSYHYRITSRNRRWRRRRVPGDRLALQQSDGVANRNGGAGSRHRRRRRLGDRNGAGPQPASFDESNYRAGVQSEDRGAALTKRYGMTEQENLSRWRGLF